MGKAMVFVSDAIFEMVRVLERRIDDDVHQRAPAAVAHHRAALPVFGIVYPDDVYRAERRVADQHRVTGAPQQGGQHMRHIARHELLGLARFGAGHVWRIGALEIER